jgi:DNA-binding SARP family transcriptional activator
MAKTMAPCADFGALQHPASWHSILENHPAVIMTAAAGYISTGEIAALCKNNNAPLLWLRLEREDSDPASLLLSLVSVLQKHSPGAGTNVIEQMRRQPGPLLGWPRLFMCLSDEFTRILPPNATIVLENAQYLVNQATPTLGLLGMYWLPSLPAPFRKIFISACPLPPNALQLQAQVIREDDLRITNLRVQDLAVRSEMKLTTPCIIRLLELCNGQSEVVDSILQAGMTFGVDFTQDAIKRSKNAQDILFRLARPLLTGMDGDLLAALSITLQTGYSNTSWNLGIIGQAILPNGPWLTPLEENWWLLRSIWKDALREQLRPEHHKPTLQRAAQYFINQGLHQQAIKIYNNLDDFPAAARTVASVADHWMSLGQWETLSHHLSQLPPSALQIWPWLIYLQGELACVQGSADAAINHLTCAANIFTKRNDPVGTCQSLLAESALALWHKNNDHATACALAASTIAETAGLTWHKGWAAWYLGCLAIASNKLEDALFFFTEAAESIHDPTMFELFQKIETLLHYQQELQRQSEFHYSAYLRTQQFEKNIAEQLGTLAQTPPTSLGNLLFERGWANLPLLIKLPTTALPFEQELFDQRSILQKLLALMGINKPRDGPPNARMSSRSYHHQEIFPTPARHVSPIATDFFPTGAETPEGFALPETAAAAAPVSAETILQPTRNAPFHPDAGPAQAQETFNMTVHCFGSFHISINDQALEKWAGSRALSVLKYLLIHRKQETSREILMDIFWPDSTPEAARNNLNVAIHHLRKLFQAINDFPIIVFEKGFYYLNHQLQIWMDVEEFERHLQTGHRLKTSGDTHSALREYEIAGSLYQGDFLEDDLYGDWTVFDRERLKVAYIDMLTHTSQIYFNQGQYANSINVCHAILERDNCREDAHCLLMRCYSCQGQHHLALRQYQTCVDALRAELDIAPDPSTVQMSERIRRRELV